ncbi:MAG: hypothetical protein US83_C0006G0074 [Candidatus Falkowbacteria bacterium GW2011_GWC2_38_22]|uniref:Uncharacterized protein n=1 Tax=Candidatus Falkowbacteria bacterium GW2011_GWE1_38_31 TaxID=1618638 RepID=A0A0G0N1U4_9BACT|nr:MAG: hypothetical protein US73_C0001G0013 [Candidatus Falkowbacteria bacterium GW2011_GWF2_38_1205]KKQ61434.1 MAG: hypothetical protein US83_C0006G0074 [Candidatus Falkowbacteria bacterium GW2011_GWC2_38_22]KKQ63981.1 MAG: hypothetical protein US84_C0002G0013 [Candidatus Falkowbacteria bacterium GW2011_GWF1_38_22]KKQ66671.1 MAG: hypothetical protein US87_C0001G0192 [Candidatus Falkowbacteria bacterium GW2011_GWE2_38_254]KKQ71086.1 MAG: hypothetical protein US91_C0001G0013 [Candidatus Falkowb
MEKFESNYLKVKFEKIDTYKGYEVYLYTLVPKECIATMLPDKDNISKAIAINPKAYKILESRPDYLERIYKHELQENTTSENIQHGNDKDILLF